MGKSPAACRALHPESLNSYFPPTAGSPAATNVQATTTRIIMAEGSEALRLLPASTPDKIGTITVQPANMSEVVGNISGLPEKMPGNSGHSPAVHSGRPENSAGISVRRFNGVEYQRFSVVGERKTGVIATGVFRELPTVSEKGADLSSPKMLLPEPQSACRDSRGLTPFSPLISTR
jgi:hypothetical protein